MRSARRAFLRRYNIGRNATAIVLACGSAVLSHPAIAQVEAGPPAGQADTVAQTAGFDASAAADIVVTARRRSEGLISVPVTVAAVSGEQMAARGINNLEGLARTVPQLILSPSNGGFQGGALSLRGIGASDGNLFGDQAVGFYIDGVMVARSTPVKMGELDTAQIEVLKGPQALYYGKNSPGGVIVLRSKDPGDHFEAGIQGGYEFNAHEWRGQGYVSTPLTESLGLRIAASGSTMRGWVKNEATPGLPTSIDEDHLPHAKEFVSRVTLKFDDGGPFKARFKYTYSWREDLGFSSTSEIVDCPTGVPRAIGTHPSRDCRANGRTLIAGAGPLFGTNLNQPVAGGGTVDAVPEYGDGKPFSTVEQQLAGLELSLDLSDALTLSSTTGLYKSRTRVLHMLVGDGTANTFAIPAAIRLNIREISEEVRLTSSFDGPFNFMVGSYLQDQKLAGPIAAAFNSASPTQLFPPFDPRQKGTGYSFFATGSYKLTDQVEFSGGARYSHEKKKVRFYRWASGNLGPAQGNLRYERGDEIPTTVPKRSWKNWSPEAVLTWRPDSRTTVYGSWKRGFISGGYNPGGGGTGVTLLGDRSYDQQVVEGFEGGAKGVLFDGALRLGFAAFNYKIKGLQASRIDPSTSSQTIANAASARSKGVEFDATWRTPLQGLTLNGAVAYTKARYLSYADGPCYGGQTPAAGCNLGPNAVLAAAIANGFDPNSGNPFPAGAAYLQQDLSGEPLVRAPDWGIALGANYDHELPSGDRLGLTVATNYSSKLYGDAANSPGSLQKGYWLLDASARYELQNGLEVALIGRNLTNEFYFQRSADGTLTAANTGRPDGLRADTIGGISRGREVMVRLSYKFR